MYYMYPNNKKEDITISQNFIRENNKTNELVLMQICHYISKQQQQQEANNVGITWGQPCGYFTTILVLVGAILFLPLLGDNITLCS